VEGYLKKLKGSWERSSLEKGAAAFLYLNRESDSAAANHPGSISLI
jgi:hypothetical protein